MKKFLVRWQEEVWIEALTPGEAANEIEGMLREHFTEDDNGPRDFTVIAEDGHTSLVKVGSDG